MDWKIYCKKNNANWNYMYPVGVSIIELINNFKKSKTMKTLIIAIMMLVSNLMYSQVSKTLYETTGVKPTDFEFKSNLRVTGIPADSIETADAHQCKITISNAEKLTFDTEGIDYSLTIESDWTMVVKERCDIVYASTTTGENVIILYDKNGNVMTVAVEMTTGVSIYYLYNQNYEKNEVKL